MEKVVYDVLFLFSSVLSFWFTYKTFVQQVSVCFGVSNSSLSYVLCRANAISAVFGPFQWE